MNEHFAIREHRGVRLLVYLPWWNEGVVHGMTMVDLDFRGERGVYSPSQQVLCRALEVNHLAVPAQVHGDKVYDLRSADSIERSLRAHSTLFKAEEGDAVLAPTQQGVADRRIAFGVLAADCVPVLVRAHTGWAAIHAGWRGLACGVIARAVSELDGISAAAVFAAAGGDRYQVGQEVVDAIGETAVCRSTADGRYLLDTAATAVKQLQLLGRISRIEAAEICTISDQRFYSFRRQGGECGRSLTFIVPGVCPKTA